MTTLNIACAACGTINRLPKDRLEDKPKCGRCKKGVFAYQPLKVTEKSFELFVMKSEVPVVVDFWATWCSPCVQFAPTFELAASQWEPKARFMKVDSDANPAISQKYGIRSIPTLALFHQGKEVTRKAGAMPTQMLNKWLEDALSELKN